ncbi:MAG: hypothetical protein ACK4K6_01305 [Pseudarthrobacter sp.]
MEGVRTAADTDIPAPAARHPFPVWAAGPLSTGLGLSAHLAAGGRAPGILIVIAVAALLGMAAAMAGPRRLPGWAVLVAAGVAQQLLHLAFAAFSTSSGFAFPGHHGGAAVPETPTAGVPAAEASGAAHSLHLMLHFHVAAALAAAAVTTQWTKVVSMVRRTGRSGGKRAPGDADA